MGVEPSPKLKVIGLKPATVLEKLTQAPTQPTLMSEAITKAGAAPTPTVVVVEETQFPLAPVKEYDEVTVGETTILEVFAPPGIQV